jgi:hypothetical protein
MQKAKSPGRGFAFFIVRNTNKLITFTDETGHSSDCVE